MAVTHNAAVTLASLQISISVQEIGNLGLDRMREKRMRSIPQDFGELIGECSWLNQLRDGIVRHGISLLQWRSGGLKHPHDMPPYRFTPSPTFAHSSTCDLRPCAIDFGLPSPRFLVSGERHLHSRLAKRVFEVPINLIKPNSLVQWPAATHLVS